MVDLSGLAYDLTGLTVPLIAIFAFILPLISKIVKNKYFPGIYALIVTLFATLSTTIIFMYLGSTLEHKTYTFRNITFNATISKPIVYGFGGWPPPIGISYEVDGLNSLIGVYIGWIMLLIVLFSLWYNRNLDEPEWYYTLLLGFEAGVLGCLYTGDAFNLFVMIEVLAISSYALIAYHKNNPGSIEAAIKYGILGATATTIYFIGLMIIYGIYGTLNMGHILYKNLQVFGNVMIGEAPPGLVLATTLAVSLALWVFTLKSGLFPNHFWLPDAYSEAPTPISAALAGLSEVIGIYVVIRFLYTVFPAFSPIGYYYRGLILEILLILGFLGGVVGALMMFIQRDLKRLLAYSSISHIGLIFMTLSIGFLALPMKRLDSILVIAFTAVVTHIIAHGLGKTLLFMSSEIFIESSGTKIMDDMRGVGRKYPWVSLAFIAGFLNLMGAIPFIGFFSKLLMYQAFIESGLLLAAIGVIIVSALSVPGYAKAIYAIVFSTPTREYRLVKTSGFKVLIIIIALALLLLGVFYSYIYSMISEYISSSITMGGLFNYERAFHEAFSKLMG
ncbi:MAG: cation:proton antiporter [Desulfurococcales archaeon ex4484_58]|nr:MAG: cation:proton antiporter [Desulfurococcales archaeon ex4484_58]